MSCQDEPSSSASPLRTVDAAQDVSLAEVDLQRLLLFTGDARARVLLRTRRFRRDRIGRGFMRGIATGTPALVAVLALALLARAWPIVRGHPLGDLLLGRQWHPQDGAFGFYPFIVGTLWVTLLAMGFAVPVSTLCAVYLADYARPGIRRVVKPLVDLLSGIPSVVYGVWGVTVVVPLIRDEIGPWVNRTWGHVSLLSTTGNPTGYGILAGGIVLAVMVLPCMTSVMEEVLRSVPDDLREATLALGTTRWLMVRRVVMKQAMPGLIAAVMLGFSRAFGETMAVLMVVGNVVQVPKSVFDAAYPLTALIANNYGEMMSVPLYDAALMGAGLLLLVVVLAFNGLARIVLGRAMRQFTEGRQ